jgi:hypothetical protein
LKVEKSHFPAHVVGFHPPGTLTGPSSKEPLINIFGGLVFSSAA